MTLWIKEKVLFVIFLLLFLSQYYFWDRNNIPTAGVFYVLLRLILCGWSMFYFVSTDRFIIRKSISKKWALAGALCYSLNGFTVMYWFWNWLDLGIIFPLIIKTCNTICNSQRKQWRFSGLCYSCLLCIMCCMNLPIAYPICLFLLLYSGTLVLIERKSNRFLNLFKLGALTVIGLGMSSVIMIPASRQIQDSSRASRNGIIPILEHMSLV